MREEKDPSHKFHWARRYRAKKWKDIYSSECFCGSEYTRTVIVATNFLKLRDHAIARYGFLALMRYPSRSQR